MRECGGPGWGVTYPGVRSTLEPLPCGSAANNMTHKNLEQIGSALYGPRWQSELARALGVNDRTVRRWVSGETPLPDSVLVELRALVAARIEALRRL